MLMCQGFRNLEARGVPTQQRSGTPMELLLLSYCELLLSFTVPLILDCTYCLVGGS